ncbi:MAG: nucleoside 2-deoxyribosyltransferase [Pseudonocardiaceae bacterium]
MSALARNATHGPNAVPFRVSESAASEVKGRRLFELDRERLASLDGMLAVLHGPSLDDGVCMEIGYAAALGVPVVVLTTDFQTYGTSEHGAALDFPDALVQAVATEIVRIDHLAPPAGHETVSGRSGIGTSASSPPL